MRRPFGVMFCGALALALLPHAASATFIPVLAPAPNLQTALMQRVFGESADRRASIAASFGDRASESPLRSDTLRVSLPLEIVAGTAASSNDPLSGDSLSNMSPTLHLVSLASYAVAPHVPIARVMRPVKFIATSVFRPLIADYQPLASAPALAPGGPSFQVHSGVQPREDASSLVSFSPIFSPIGGFTANTTAIDGTGFATSPSDALTVPLGVRIGGLRMQTRFQGAQVESPQLALQDRATGVGADFNVRAGARKVNVDLSSTYERMTRTGNPALASSNFDNTATLELPSDGAPVLVPAFADVSKHTLSTGLAVPVTRSLTFGVKYNAQHLLGGYGSPGLSNLDAQANTYGAKLTYTIPHTSSALTFSAKQMHYQDNLLPLNTFTQTRADVNFTVKF